MQKIKLFSCTGLFLFSFLLIVFITGCSSIMNKSLQNVDVKSSESEAQIFVNGISNGKTPTILKLQRGDVYLIEVKKPGFETFRISTSKSITGWFWGNLLCGGVVGMVIDLATGNAYDIEPRYINASLSKSTAMLEKYNSSDLSQVFIKDKTGKIVNTFAIEWE